MLYTPRVLRRLLIVALVVVLAPSILAAGLGIWTPWGGLQQHLALDLLLDILLWLESFEPRTSRIDTGLIGWWEVPLLVGTALVLFGSTWDRKLPRPLQPLVDVPEMVLVALGLVAVSAVVAVGASVDRLVFWGGLALACGTGLWVHGPSKPAEDEGGWRAPSNRLRRAAVAGVSAAVAYYGVTSLWEGASYRNPVFRVAEVWIQGPGSSPWTSGGVWLIAAGAPGALLVWRWARRDGVGRDVPLRAAGAGAVIVVAAFLAAPGQLGIAAALSAIGMLLLAAGAGPMVLGRKLPRRGPFGVLDPRQIAAWAIPIVAWSGLCLARGFTVAMWTAPTTLPDGVERLADVECGFGMVTTDDGSAYWTDRCRREIGRVGPDGSVQRWDLQALGVEHVEELGGPDADGTMYVAVTSSSTPEARLVFLAIEGEHGPRGLPGMGETDADRAAGDKPAYLPMPNCWVSSWIPIPGSDDVLIGCENRSGADRLRPTERSKIQEIALTNRIETGAFAGPDRLVGVSLWEDPRITAWDWPSGDEVASRLLGPFNWTVTRVPEPEALWVGRFIEGEVLVLDPTTLATQDRVRLSFGVRAMTYDPVHDRVWAAAAYTGLIWSIEAKAPYRRRALPLCGEARDLATDAQGRLMVATDCGVYRVDPGGW
ncbi:MAG: hypothetical protein GY898_29735 [Proteobacteria bacterium]|nr:hypothetical protein [Pseudomonadota bacterium]